jgi:hypothetical protein
MADKYQFEAQRAQDVIVNPTAARPYTYDINHVDVSRTQKSPADIPSDKLPIPPRTINLMLESETRISVDANSMSWNLNFRDPNPLKEGTVLTWRDISINMGTVTAGTFVELALSGFGVHSFRTSSAMFDFRVPGVVETSTPSLIALVGTSSLSATLRNPSSTLTNARVTLHRLSGGNAWDSNTTVRVGLTLTEPGTDI